MRLLAKHDKSLLLPLIVFENVEAGGLYYQPGRYEVELNGHFYDAKKGIIVANPEFPDGIDATITHEWRHHWQRFNRIVGDAFPKWPWQPSVDYEASIKAYFQIWHEWDALMFEYKFARNHINESWVEILKTH